MTRSAHGVLQDSNLKEVIDEDMMQSRSEKHAAEIRRIRDARMYMQYEEMQKAGRRPPYSRAKKKIIDGARRLADSMPRGMQLLYDPYLDKR
jgi:hypothetical protein